MGRAIKGAVGSSARVRIRETSTPVPLPGAEPVVRSAYGTALGFGGWEDRLTFSAGTATTLDLSLRWTGRVGVATSSSGDGIATASVEAVWGFGAYSATGYAQLINPYGNGAGADMTSPGSELGSDFALIDDARTFHIPLVGPGGLRTSMLLNYYVYSRAEAGGLAGPGAGMFSALATSDMRHTGLVTGLVFRDADGSGTVATGPTTRARPTRPQRPAMRPCSCPPAQRQTMEDPHRRCRGAQ